jgi:hypothetical protein
LGDSQQPHRVADPRPDDVEDSGTQSDSDEKRRKDQREDVGRVAGA